MLRSKKAQITVFIIVGLVLLLGTGTVLYMRQQGIGVADFIKPESPPVEAYIEACLSQVSEDAIRILGSQGGFITVPEEIAANPARHVSLVPGVAFELAPKVPYWYFEGKTEIPSLNYMQLQTEYYIDNNLDQCINNFEGLTDIYDIQAADKWESKVVFADKDTTVQLNWPVSIEERGSGEKTEKETFLIKHDVNVKRMYELSKELLIAENQKMMFEEMTVDLMASYPPSIIPFDGLSVNCGREHWLLSNIKKELISALEPAIMGLRFRNTDHPPFLEDEDAYQAVAAAAKSHRDAEQRTKLVLPKKIPADSYDYFQYYFNFTENDYSDLKVLANFRKEWGLSLHATPSQYGVMKSGVQDLKSQIMTFLCLNNYHFVYDIYYPVMISVSDTQAFRGRGYAFRWAMPVQVYHNKGERFATPVEEWEPDEFDFDPCESYGGETYTIRARDSISNAEISKVNLTFSCLEVSCSLGQTKTNNYHLEWSGSFPQGCGNPVIRASKPGYLTTEKQFPYGSSVLYIDMDPTVEVGFTMRKHREGSTSRAMFLDGDQHAVIGIEHKDPDMSLFYSFSADETFNSKQTMELLQDDATYDVSIMLFKQLSSDQDVMVGGWIGKWDVKYSDIADASKVEFHVFEKYPYPQTDEEFVKTYELISNHSLYPEITHEFIRADNPQPQEEVSEQ